MNRIVITDPAKQDLLDISRFIARNNQDAARQIKQRIKQVCRTLADFPKMGRRWDNIVPPLRSFPVDSYLIFYRPIAEGIEVVRVVSGYRDIETLFSSQDED